MNLADLSDDPSVIALDITDQVFTFLDEEGTEWHWNASAGMRLVEATGRRPLAFYPSDHGLTIAHLVRQYPDLDLDYAKATDVTKPILFVPFWNGTSVLIDGWHRLSRSLQEGIPLVLCHELTQEEAEQILILKLPARPKAPELLPTKSPAKGGRR